jgi:hypothetical protein
VASSRSSPLKIRRLILVGEKLPTCRMWGVVAI